MITQLNNFNLSGKNLNDSSPVGFRSLLFKIKNQFHSLVESFRVEQETSFQVILLGHALLGERS